jgi:putative peptide maturation dehydrogenase
VELSTGSAKKATATKIIASSILTGQEYSIEREEFRLLLTIPTDKWVSITEITEQYQVNAEQVCALAHKGLLLSDGADSGLVKLKTRDEQLASAQWFNYAALYHFMTSWRDKDLTPPQPLEEPDQARVREIINEIGEPPAPFHAAANAEGVYQLPIVNRTDGLYDLLVKRKTTRSFDRDQPMSVEELSIILYYVYGCHGYAPFLGDIIALKRTSPSGGSLHPIEVYLLINNVGELAPGLYHYYLKTHALELITRLSRQEATELATRFTAGQFYFGQAHALFIMTARFYRNFWKYRKHDKAYRVIFMDAAHLSQTFYLVCTELGLGAFVSAAINSVNIEESLGLDGFEEGAIAVCGCGVVSKTGSRFDSDFQPFLPRETMI